MLRRIAKILRKLGIDTTRINENIAEISIKWSLVENGMLPTIKRLKSIVPDLSDQYSFGTEPLNSYSDLKIRGMHAFQCSLMLEAIKDMPGNPLTIVDIGDSAGTHMRYLQALVKEGKNIDAISVNLDPHAIEKIRSKGGKAILCRAEDLYLGDKKVDLFTSFQMVEHLHNPAVFFRRLAKKSNCSRMLVTVPYVKRSRLGFYHIRANSIKPIHAEEEHIFELCPDDWTLLFRHSGWRVVYSKIYYQYPRRIPLLANILAGFWRATNFEGFWGCILEKDTAFSDCYLDWEP